MLFSALFGVVLISLVPIALLSLLPLLPTASGKRTISPYQSRQWVPSSAMLNSMLSFAAGSLLGDAFFHILSHSMLGEYPSIENSRKSAMNTLWSFFIFYALDTLSRLGRTRTFRDTGDISGNPTKSPDLLLTPFNKGQHSSDKNTGGPRKRGTPSPGLKMLSTGQSQACEETIKVHNCCAAVPSLVADAVHNFTDGLAISAAFAKDFKLGLSTTFAIFFHEIPHELGDYAILFRAGFKHKQVILLQLLTAFGALLGALVGAGVHYGWFPESLSISEDALLPFAAGGFIYVALCTILPEVLEDCSEASSLSKAAMNLIAFSTGIVVMALFG